jgi:glycosyltransferase involved in cell wall biosynthesis
MKIINAIHAQSIGGVDHVFRNYTEVLSRQGHEVALLISDNGRDKYHDLDVKKIFKLKNSSQVFDFLNLLRITLLFKPDLIICHSNRMMRWMKFLKFFTKTKSVAINHGIDFKRSLHCDYVISINQEITQMVVDAGFEKDKTFTLTNVIKVDQEYYKKTLKNPPVIGMYARIEKRKGFDILIQACEILKNKGHDFILKIGGFEVVQIKASEFRNPYNINTIQDFVKTHNIEDKYKFVGTVIDKKNFFSDVDIFCMPSREEPFGLVALEGFLYSTLVISSASVGGEMLIKDGFNGSLFEIENPADLAEKIIAVLKNPASYETITKNAFSRLEKEFSFDFLDQEMSKILQKIFQNA